MQTAEIKHLAFLYFLGDVAKNIVGLSNNWRNNEADWNFYDTVNDMQIIYPAYKSENVL